MYGLCTRLSCLTMKEKEQFPFTLSARCFVFVVGSTLVTDRRLPFGAWN
jgi:hypothetical protein